MTGALKTLAVWKFASCDGCQLSLLDCEDELLAIAGAIRIANFTEASITTAHDAARIREVRSQSRFLVAIGACAIAGGIQSLRNFADVAEFRRAGYARPDYIDTLATSTPIAQHVKVDFELRGCPVDKHQLLEVLSAFLHRRKPVVPTESVCTECKRRGNPCVMVAHGAACLGPVTQAGCGAICPAYARGCYGCFGPMESPNTPPLAARLGELGMDAAGLTRVFRTFNAGAAAFRAEGDQHGG